ncbi:unnamed protein product [Caenorhabditis angaria]|uniref:Transmembrane protein 65 n=1 Tax=Caenorhabditis angaria TaxID=860376 RepID=A0A9P1IHS0_9PELO|nr:unnamed protein product [Caenorhabditis angaria]
MNKSFVKIISRHHRLFCTPSSSSIPPCSEAAEKKRPKKREFFTKKSILPHGIQNSDDAKVFSSQLLPGERKLIFDTLRKITADQYNEHKEVIKTEIHHEDVKRLWYLNFIPMFVFGILDEACLIIGGDAINHFFSVYNGMSMLASTAVANIMANLILQIPAENCSRYLNFMKPTLSSDQMNTVDYQKITFTAKIVGLWLGLLIGLIPLVFVDDMIDNRSDIISKNNWIESFNHRFRSQQYNEYIDLNEDKLENSGDKLPDKDHNFNADDVE